MDDKTLQTYLDKLGDRIAVKQFCQDGNCQQTKNIERKKDIVDRLKQKLFGSKDVESSPCSSKNTTGQTTAGQTFYRSTQGRKRHLELNSYATKRVRKVSFGWIVKKNNGSILKQINKNMGGGTRTVNVAKTDTKTELLSKAIELFFPDGTSKMGSLKEFDSVELLDFAYSVYPAEKTVVEFYTETGLDRLKFLSIHHRFTSKKQSVF